MKNGLLKSKTKHVKVMLLCMLCAIVVCVTAAAILLRGNRTRSAFAVETADGLYQAVEDAPTYSTETVIEIEKGFQVDGELTVTAGKNIRFTGNDEVVLDLAGGLWVAPDSRVTFDVETAFANTVKVEGTLTMNGRVYNTAEIEVANVYSQYAEIKSEGVFINGSLNNDAAKGGAITINENATLTVGASSVYTYKDAQGTAQTQSNYDGGAILLKAGANGLGLEVNGTLQNNGSVIYDNAAAINGIAGNAAVPATFIAAANLLNTPNLNGTYVVYNDGNAGKAGTVELPNYGIAYNIDIPAINLLSFGKITYRRGANTAVCFTMANAVSFGGGTVNGTTFTQGANELIFDGGAVWNRGNEFYYANTINNNTVIFYGEENKPYIYNNTGVTVPNSFFTVNNGGNLAMYSGVKLTNAEFNVQALANANGRGGCVNVAAGATFDMYGGEISWCAVTGHGDNAAGAGICTWGAVNMYGGAVTHNALGNSGINSADGAGVVAVNGTVNMYGGEVSYNHGALGNGADGGGIQAWGNGSQLNLYGGEIYGNFAGSAGGGITTYLGKINMFGGNIRSNRAAFGGGINNIEGALTISGGRIADNEAFQNIVNGNPTGGYGGGICAGANNNNNQVSASVTISGDAVISGNRAYYGGGLAVYTRHIDGKESNRIIMTGGTVIGNSAYKLPDTANGYYATYGEAVSENGGGVYVRATNDTQKEMLVLSGNASIDSSNSVSFSYAQALTQAPILVDGNLTANGLGAFIYMDAKTFLADVTKGGTNKLIDFAQGVSATAFLDKFALDNQTYQLAVLANQNYITLLNEESIIARIAQNQASNKYAYEVNDPYYDGYYAYTTLIDAVNDVNEDGAIEITRTTTISTGSFGGRFLINKNITIQPAEGKDVSLIVAAAADFSEAESLFRVINGKTLTLNGTNGAGSRLTIDGNGNGRENSQGLENSNISLIALDKGNLVMQGNIYLRNNVTQKAGSAVTISENGGTFTMNGGVIENNSTEAVNGGAVYLSNGTFNWNGGTISGNVNENSEANFSIYLASMYSRLNINGAVETDGVIFAAVAASATIITAEEKFTTSAESIYVALPSSEYLSAGMNILKAKSEAQSEKFVVYNKPENIGIASSKGENDEYYTVYLYKITTYIFDSKANAPKDIEVTKAYNEATLEEFVEKYPAIDSVLTREGGFTLVIRLRSDLGGTITSEAIQWLNSAFTGRKLEADLETPYYIRSWGNYTALDNISFVDSDTPIVLNAVWVDNADASTDRYSVTFNANGGDFVSTPDEVYSFVCSANEDISGIEVTRSGYKFLGWTYERNATEAKFIRAINLTKSEANLIPKDENKNIVLYAVWEAVENTITYNADGGTITSGNYTTKYTIETETITLPQATRAGYTLVGWYLNGVKVEGIGNLPEIGEDNATVELTAQWEQITFTVEYYVDENDTAFATDSEVDVEAIIDLPAKTTQAQALRVGYTISGWKLKIGGQLSNRVYGGQLTANEIAVIEGAVAEGNVISFVAQWTVVNYTVSYVLNGGTNNENNPKTYTVNDTFTLEDATREKYTFAGWYDGDTQVTQIGNGKTGNLILTARWNAIANTITYNANGGDITSVGYTTTYTVETVSISLPQATRNGYTLDGWFLNGVEVKTVADLPEIEGGTTVTLTAKWTAVTYTITYVLNDGTNNPANPATYTIEDNITLLPATREGYVFTGWMTSSGVTVERIPQGSTGDRTLVAQWRIITNTVSFVDEADNKLADSITYTITTESITLPQVTRNGYTLDGWFNGDKKVETLADLPAIGADNATVTLTAKWTAVTYTITYVLNGGTNAENPATYTIETATFALKDATRTNYTFEGWFTSPYFEGAKVTEIEKGTAGDITLYAKWKADEYTVTLIYNDGKTPNEVIKYTVDTPDFNLLPATREGYTFNGWLDENDEVVTTVKSGSTKNIRLTASWTAVTYAITYVLNGGINDASNPTSYTIESAAITLKPATRLGYTFLGWNDGGIIAAGSTGNKTFTASWSENPVDYTVVFKNGNDETTETKTVGDSVILSALERDGYIFEGWTNNGVTYSGTLSIAQLLTIAEVIDNTITFTAKWSQPITYTITYILNGGTNAENPAEYNVTTATITLKDATRANYTFLGWFNGDTQVTQIEKGSTGNLVLTAKWEVTQVAITVSAGNGTFTIESDDKYTVSGNEITFKVDYDGNIYDELLTLQGHLKANNVNDKFLYWNGLSSVLASYYAGNSAYSITAEYSATIVSVTYIFIDGSVTTDFPDLGEEYSYDDVAHSIQAGYTNYGWELKTQNVTWMNGDKLFDSITLQETCDAEEYTVSFDVEGCDSITVTFNSAYGTLPVPEKDGYVFDGWFDENGNRITEETIVSTVGDHGLIAHWTAIKYTISFDLNGGIGNAVTQMGKTIVDDITLAELTKLGYSFSGWKVDDSDIFNGTVSVGELIAYANGDNVITLVAQWANTSYTIQWKNGTQTTEEANKQLGDQIAFTSPTASAGYEFLGWQITLEGGNTVIYTTEQVTVQDLLVLNVRLEDSKIVFTAQWKAIEYTITYELGNGYNNPANPASYTVESGEITLLAPTAPVGYTFAGWDNGGKIDAGSTGNKTFTAQWQLINYNITYDLNGGTNPASNLATYTVNDRITFADATRAGYTFLGWFNENGNAVSVIEQGSTGDVKLIARWTAETYTITYELNGGTNSPSNPASYSVTDGTITLANATKLGYTFKGWFKDGVQVSTIEGTGEITLTAQWDVIIYTVKVNGAVHGTYNMDGDQTITLPKLVNEEGLTFMGWEVNGDDSHIYNPDGNTFNLADVIPASGTEITFVARWYNASVSHTITYTLNGGEFTGDYQVSFTEGTAYTLPTPQRANYEFKGWYTSPNLTGNPITEASGNTDIRVWAKWERIAVTVSGSIQGWTYGEEANTPTVSENCAYLYGTYKGGPQYSPASYNWSNIAPENAGTYCLLVYFLFDGEDTATPDRWNDINGWTIIEFTIAKKVIDLPTLVIDATNSAYTGEYLTALLEGFDASVMAIELTTATPLFNEGEIMLRVLNAGRYSITFKLLNAVNYEWNREQLTDGKATVEWNVARLQLIRPTADTSEFKVVSRWLYYKPVGFDENTMEIKGDYRAWLGGNYKAIVSIKDKVNYEWEDGTQDDIEFEWTVTGVSIIFVAIISTLGGLTLIAAGLLIGQCVVQRRKKKREAQAVDELTEEYAEEQANAENAAESTNEEQANGENAAESANEDNPAADNADNNGEDAQ